MLLGIEKLNPKKKQIRVSTVIGKISMSEIDKIKYTQEIMNAQKKACSLVLDI